MLLIGCRLIGITLILLLSGDPLAKKMNIGTTLKSFDIEAQQAEKI